MTGPPEIGRMNATSSQPMRLYVPGGLPSGRDLIDIFTIFECSLAWAPIGIAYEARDKAWVRHLKAEGKEARKADLERIMWDEVLSPIERSYSQFLSSKYKPLLLEALSAYWNPVFDVLKSLIHLYHMESKEGENASILRREFGLVLQELEAMNESLRPEMQADRVIDLMSFWGERFNIGDFGDWVATDIGTNLLSIHEIRSDKSVEFLFDAAAVTAIVFCQNSPTFKDIAVYTVGVLRSYMGKQKKPIPQKGMKPPTLTPSMQRLIGEFDEVHLEWEAETARFVLRMKKKTH